MQRSSVDRGSFGLKVVVFLIRRVEILVLGRGVIYYWFGGYYFAWARHWFRELVLVLVFYSVRCIVQGIVILFVFLFHSNTLTDDLKDKRLTC